VSSWWIILFVIKSTLTACLRNRDHLILKSFELLKIYWLIDFPS